MITIPISALKPAAVFHSKTAFRLGNAKTKRRIKTTFNHLKNKRVRLGVNFAKKRPSPLPLVTAQNKNVAPVKVRKKTGLFPRRDLEKLQVESKKIRGGTAFF
jgi:hypothetical protein